MKATDSATASISASQQGKERRRVSPQDDTFPGKQSPGVKGVEEKLPANPKADNQERPTVGKTEGSMPSAENGYQFKYGSPSGRTALELNNLLKPPVYPIECPMDSMFEGTYISKSYKRIGSHPPPGLADRLVEQMENDHKARILRETEMDLEE
ncbi:hypothetical protein BKA66DRAFT_446074 [Pyrenochaeta sp. MPI-SDFR-AT-0127]|nr:hypothetical protein BKA66DRAFT_446074 [Pyrenochaeta sp. MPI-SDFR-AT-0127]